MSSEIGMVRARRIAVTVALALSMAANAIGGDGLAPLAGAAAGKPATARPPVAPLLFISNVGQFNPSVNYVVHAERATYLLWPQPTIHLEASGGLSATLTFVGANSHPTVQPMHSVPTHVSYYLSAARSDWHADVPVFDGLRLVNLYPHIDLEMTGAGGRLQPRIVGHKGADLRTVIVRVDGAARLHLSPTSILMTLAKTTVVPFTLLTVVNDSGGHLPGEHARPVLKGNEVSTPFLQKTHATEADAGGAGFSTYLADMSGGADLALGHAGQTYVVGGGDAYDFASAPFGDVAVASVNPHGAGLAYLTFIGGTTFQDGVAIAVDGADSAYVTGDTGSPDFVTTTGAFQSSCGGSGSGSPCDDAFVTKLDSGGHLVYSTFLGGSGYEFGSAIAVDPAGDAYVAGSTESADFPVTKRAVQRQCGGGCGPSDGFVARLNPTGTALIYATYLGGSSQDQANGIAVDSAGDAYVAGDTLSPDYPTTKGAFQSTCTAGSDGLCLYATISVLNPTGTAFVYSSYLGTTDAYPSSAAGVAVDPAGHAYVAGSTWSSHFPVTKNAFQKTFGGGHTGPVGWRPPGARGGGRSIPPFSQQFWGDGFVLEMNAAGSALIYSSYLGGRGADDTSGIAIDSAGNAYVSGVTESPNFPVTTNAFQTTYAGGCLSTTQSDLPCGDAFMAKVNPTGSALLYASYLGGSGEDVGDAVATDGAGTIYVSGTTNSRDFPTSPGAVRTLDDSGIRFPSTVSLYYGAAFVTALPTS